MAAVWAWQSLLGKGSTLDLCKFIGSFFQRCLSQCPCHETDVAIQKNIGRCFAAVWAGRWPAVDHNGDPYPAGSDEANRAREPLAGGYFAILWLDKGDLDYKSYFALLPRESSGSPCGLCQGNREDGPLSWNDFRTQPDHSVWMRLDVWRHLYPNPLPLITLVGVSILTHAIDYMHTKHLSTDQYCQGSILWITVFWLLSDSRERNCAALFEAIKAAYDRVGARCRYSVLKLSMFQVGVSGYPCLNGKAAEIRWLTPARLDVWKRHMDPTDELHTKILVTLESSNTIDRILDLFRDSTVLSEPHNREFV